jgi:hypothetical protein
MAPQGFGLVAHPGCGCDAACLLSVDAGRLVECPASATGESAASKIPGAGNDICAARRAAPRIAVPGRPQRTASGGRGSSSRSVVAGASGAASRGAKPRRARNSRIASSGCCPQLRRTATMNPSAALEERTYHASRANTRRHSQNQSCAHTRTHTHTHTRPAHMRKHSRAATARSDIRARKGRRERQGARVAEPAIWLTCAVRQIPVRRPAHAQLLHLRQRC